MSGTSASRMSFELLANDGLARRGRRIVPRGTVETPAFMPVGRYGSVKGTLPEQPRALGAAPAAYDDEPRDHIGAFVGPDFAPDDIAGHLAAWRGKCSERPRLALVR